MAIQALSETDSEFCSLLAEYEEICTWLDARDADRPPVPEEFETARELARGIEREIGRVLKNQ